MASTTNAILRASRPMFSQTLRSSTTNTTSGSAFARAGRQQQQFTGFRFQQGGRRWQSTGDAAGNAGQQGQGQQQQGQQANWFKKMWESEVGFKTVHFWAPVMKWSLVLAGISDFARPAEKLSFTQNFALTCTGLIWTRWCMVIKPKNYLLAAVNFFLALVGIGQISRIAMHESSKKAAVADIKEDVEEHAKAVKDAVKS